MGSSTLEHSASAGFPTGGGRRSRTIAPALAEHPPVDALVAIVPTRADFTLIQTEGWYRVPVASAPEALLAGQVRSLAFYLPKVFREDAWQVRWIAPLLGSVVRSRRELLPYEPAHPHADDLYLRLALGPLTALARPIPSRRLRRITFIPTTCAKLNTAAEINDLFHASPIEDALWQALKREGIEAEREYFVPGDRGGRYALDFAIFGQQRNLDVECDGDAYHANPTRARYDNRRNNFLTTRGWSVLRFTTAQIREEMPEVLMQVRSAIKSCGGATHMAPSDAPAQPPDVLWQPALWDGAMARGHSVDLRQPARRQRRR
jgi:very-short-patch-repair endonuclease